MSESFVLIGGSGHAKVIIDCIRASGGEIVGILDDGIDTGTEVLGVPVLGKTEEFAAYSNHSFVVAIGNNSIRRKIAENVNVKWGIVVHPSAVVSGYATIGEGTVIMPNAVVNAGAVIGKHCIVNTGAVV